MGIKSVIEADYLASLAALAWQVDLGADEAICEAPQNAYDLPDKAPWQAARPAEAAAAPSAAKTALTPAPARPDPSAEAAAALAEAAQIAASCPDLPSLEAAAAAFHRCDLRKGARAPVAGLGPEQAAVLILCDPPSAENERLGRAVGEGEMALIEAIFGAIGLGCKDKDAATAFHLAPCLPWPLRGDTAAQKAALDMMRPFALRRIALVAPKVVVVMGHDAATMILQTNEMARARSAWHATAGAAAPAWVMQAPQIIAKSGAAKRAAWADALAIKAALRAQSSG